MAEVGAPMELSARGKIILGCALLLTAALAILAWRTQTTWFRWLAFIVGVVFTSWAVDSFLQLLRPSPARELVRSIVVTPAALGVLLISAAGAVLGIFISLVSWYVLVALPFIFVGASAASGVIGGASIHYLALLTAICIGAYAGDKVLLPIKYVLILTRGKGDSSARRNFEAARTLLRIVRFRQLAYVITTLAYVVTELFRVADRSAPNGIDGASGVALAALVTFLSVDAYVSAFHAELLEHSPVLNYD